MSKLLKVVGTFLLLAALVFFASVQFGFIVMETLPIPSFSHLWEEYRHAMVIVIINAIVGVGLVSQVIDLNRQHLHNFSMLATFMVITATAFILPLGGLYPNPIVVLGSVILILAIFAAGIVSLNNGHTAIKPATVMPGIFVSYLCICTPALNTTFILASLTSITILVVYKLSCSFTNTSQQDTSS